MKTSHTSHVTMARQIARLAGVSLTLVRHNASKVCISLLILAGCPSPPASTVPGNNAPVANAGASQVVKAGASVTLDGSASTDPDGDPITLSWKQTQGTPVSLSSTTGAVVTLTAPVMGTNLSFELTVSDGKAASVARVDVSVRPPEDSSAQLEEMLQRPISEDPAAMGDFPNGWLVNTGMDIPVRPPDEIEEFIETFENTQAAPVVEEDLLPGDTRTVSLDVAGPSGLAGSARWVGTIAPLEVTLAIDGAPLATGSAYHFGTNRGGTFLQAKTAVGGAASISVTNTSDVAVKVRIVFMAAR